MSIKDKKLAQLKLLLSTLVTGMDVFGDVASPENKRKAAGLKAEIEHEIAELEGQPETGGDVKADDHGHDHTHGRREGGDASDPANILKAIKDVVDEMGEHHKDAEFQGFAFVLLHKQGTHTIIHGAGAGDEDAVFEAITRRFVKQKMDLED